MRALLLRIAAAGVAIATSFGHAAAGPVLVELYTSQGCNSCPPADEILGELASRQDVVALSLNVDYWDYLGWKDAFGKPEHTRRQQAYQAQFGARTVYTPQMVVQGRQAVVGNQAVQVMTAVDGHGRNPNEADVNLSREGDELVATIAPRFDGLAGPATVWLIGYSGPHAVPIRHGENAGRTITYHNVARSMRQVGEWDAASPVQFRTPVDASMKGYAVVVQQNLVGPVYGAEKIEFQQ